MAARRLTSSSSWVAAWLLLGLAAPASSTSLHEAEAERPAAADVTPGLLSDAEILALIPPPPEAAPLLAEALPHGEASDVQIASPQTTASLAPVPALVAPPGKPEIEDRDIAHLMPAPPEPAPIVLDDVVIVRLPDEPPLDTRPSPAVAPAPEGMAAGAAPTAAPPAEELTGLIAGALPEAVKQAWLPESDRREIVAFYEARKHMPLWMDAGELNAAGKRLAAQLRRAPEDGLRAEDYALPRLILPRAIDLALNEIRLTTLAVRYARDARGARLDPRRLSALLTPTREMPRAEEVLARLTAEGADAGQVLASYQPTHDGYRALRAKLMALQAQRVATQAIPNAAAPAHPRIPQGPAVRIGMRDDRIVLVRARFGFAPDETRQHDRQLATVIAGFQKENGLPVNGVLNRATVDAMNGGPDGGRASALEADLIAAMERWRWLPADLGEEHIVVNVPEYMVRKVEAGRIVHSARVVVGKTERPTPIFSDLMDHLVVNPSWTVPPTILKQDILPKLATDPGYAERRGFQVIQRGNQISVRQPPGPTNALGNIKFMFPNDHAVYLHDTPLRNLFGSGRRAFSSGCVRVEQPLKLASLVLGGADGGWSERRLQGMIGAGERTIRLTRKMPIHIIYMTHVVDAGGEVRTFEDIYGFHRRTRDALGL